MCIAIVKPAGVEITEKALYNGWKSNDDGAGFCCINEDGDFIIHKSMTWLGFIYEYKKCEELYGDTSIFLIHFRITSKGATSLDNCHPFLVDEDRVIIHNGTITSIPMDKKETRSDTKIFAEEYLRYLPDNWEDNPVIAELIEEYIGYSKVCMLHRDKGFYIFNESLGHWDEGIWYSNDTYKDKVYYMDNYYGKGNKDTGVPPYARVSGFYSHKEKKFIPAGVANLMTDTEIIEHSKYSIGVTRVTCSKCNEWCNKEDTITIMGTDFEDTVCFYCLDNDVNDKEWAKCDSCNMSHQVEELNTYYSVVEGKSLNLCELCYEWAQSYAIQLIELKGEE